MIPRLSGRRAPSRAPLAENGPLPLPSRAEAEHVFRQFFRLIERFEQAEALAPEIKAGRRRASRAKRRTTAVREDAL